MGRKAPVRLTIQAGAYSSRNTPTSTWSWTALRNINYFIQGLATSPVDTTDKNNFMGLAKFFRAYFYLGMVQQFGDVPWINTPLDVNDTAVFGHRSPRLLVIDSVVADLQYAATHITATTDGTASTITKYTAYGLLSRVLSVWGTYQKYQFRPNGYCQPATAAGGQCGATGRSAVAVLASIPVREPDSRVPIAACSSPTRLSRRKSC